MNKQQASLIERIAESLTSNGIKYNLRGASSGSVYFTTNYTVLPQIRIANHTGHKQPPRSIEYRTDAATKKTGTRMIFGKGDESRLLAEIKKRFGV